MNLIKYFKYYYQLTNGRFINFIILTMGASGFQLLAALSIVTVTKFGEFNVKENHITNLTFPIIESVGFTDEKSQFTLLLAVAFVAFIFSGALFIYSIYYTAKLQASIYVKLQKKAVRDLIGSDYQFYMTNNVGHLNNVIAGQIRQVSQSFKFYTNIITSFLLGIAYGIVPVVNSWKLVLLMLGAGLPMVGLVLWINRKTKQCSIDMVNEQSKLNSVLFQVLSHFKYLKSTETYSAVFSKHAGYIQTLAGLLKKISLLGAINDHGLFTFAVCFSILMIGWQNLMMDVPIVESVTILGLLYVALRKLSTIPISYQKFVGVAGAIIVCEQLNHEMLEHKESVDGPEHDATPDLTGGITFQNVSFRYASGEGDVLKEMNFSIAPKTAVAFVGGSGAGKSTIVNMITGLLRPTSGEIKLAETPYEKLNLRELRKGIGYITQEPVIFNDTVLNNLSLWTDVDNTQIIEVAKKAHADDFIQKFPEKYQTMLGDNGLNVSGGQRQRLTIARELLRDTPILIMDEATSSLDSETEKQIQESVDMCRGKQTLIIIAHRLSTIKNCDTIYVLDNGSIIEQGAYDELYNQNGRFKSMVDAQQ